MSRFGRGRIHGGSWASKRGYRDPAKPQYAWMRFVCEPELRRKMVEMAQREETTLSEIARRACREFIERG